MSTVAADVRVYAEGIGRASICVLEDQPGADTIVHLNATHHPGTEHGWQVSNDETFRTGEPNPCPCNSDPSRLHYLLDC